MTQEQQRSRPSTPPMRRPRFGSRMGIGFFGEVISELRKVNWPSRQETTRLTLLVLAISVSMGIFLGLTDNLFARLFAIVSR